MNAVLTSTSKPSSSGIVAVTRLVPASVSRTGFYPIQPQNGAALQSTSRNHSVLNSQKLWKRNSVGDSGVPTSSFRPVSDTCISKSNNFVKEEQLPGRSSGVAENNQVLCLFPLFIYFLYVCVNRGRYLRSRNQILLSAVNGQWCQLASTNYKPPVIYSLFMK